MKRIEVTAPDGSREAVADVLEEYSDDVTVDEVEKEEAAFLKFDLTVDSDVIDDLTQEVKEITEIDSGDLTIEVIDESTVIEKGRRQEGGTSALSVQEMYAKAFEFSSFNVRSWALIGLAAGIAVFGTIMDNVMVVIGAMVIAPMLGPYISWSFGLVIGDRRLIQDSTFYGILSLLFAIAVSFLFSLVTVIPLSLEPTEVMRLIANPGFFTVPLSLLVGAAAALTFTTELRESLAGVAVAIALVPPAAVAGMALAMLRLSMFFDVSMVLLTNLSALLLAGSLTFKLVGVAPSTYYQQKVSKKELRNALVVSVISMLVVGSVLAYLSFVDFQNENVRQNIEAAVQEYAGDNLLRQEIRLNGDRIEATLTVVDPEFTAEELENVLESRTGRAANITLIAVQGQER